MLTDDVRYRAVQSRDARFDGIFYLGVTSTGIYCRPSCPARTPRRDNVRFYRSAAEAQAAGFRACRRCRPDTTPGSPEWNVRADVAARAMRLIADGLVDRTGVSGLAARLGYSQRQVHRTLVDEVGAGPMRLARAQRAHTARTLLETTRLDISEIAFAAGFASIRQFNETIREIYACTPSALRARAPGHASPQHGISSAAGTIELRLAYRQPADFDGLLRFLADRAVPGVEEVVGYTYRRSLSLPHGACVAELSPESRWVRAVLHLSDPRDLPVAVARCRRILDLDADPRAVDDALGEDPLLRPLVDAAPGRRVPGTADGAELAVRAVLGQQISVAAARTHAARLVRAHGTPLDGPVGNVTHMFPTADVLTAPDATALRMPASRRRTLAELATRLVDGRLRLDPGADWDEAGRQLLGVPGIGAWTAGYVRMRALGDPDVFLSTDLAVRHALARLGFSGGTREITARAERWQPWRSYALMHVWAATNTMKIEKEKYSCPPIGAKPTARSAHYSSPPTTPA
ncbi:DNA-3-methyladenine glycosylase 2 family protein [Actinobacteria bacterium YIM 96077]|uniref:DNA-3-methyladenine glycosylase II n=1 Tax=Phytoactinopolyspora halophila TaxID=1981511 RepID=A0A329R1I3_9ACTN|nr:DNA-3-methyladenine glycosylase 2 family protein [Phytoactinopolyspora halophila]AYY11462.1 DNA-3-methyladenine glycosylase 2 family protein [Actinobacteria bacterium YIM 96077]RAW18056.1 DNA-3-methyladenine glycosylase 2 family protein [Phytoactinopolyspora halophila]